jgi:hypothetical protein
MVEGFPYRGNSFDSIVISKCLRGIGNDSSTAIMVPILQPIAQKQQRPEARLLRYGEICDDRLKYGIPISYNSDDRIYTLADAATRKTALVHSRQKNQHIISRN